ncbi:deoxyribose-phosphate aldolase [Flavobacterium reichenbachii]|uniref:Deoxyribose-phosphate aldolase n=1 Tax=Flavobacterium reichenbachii TaxID=362418 RepID=A0A085ZQW1_9FLAO|nr:deoxyribose-phosphate aldolase [Flavobacterium reichenbachii]KFF06825.1 deoxyribose-phosphate aldolase [Flavobacterium reichenbachii]OXB18576.1 deoxyribose-phosphate aldolase [Flavobacterium reichenbachii]
MNVKPYLDSTYLKTAHQAGLSEAENTIVVKNAIEEAIVEGFKLIMIRPEYVSLAKTMIISAESKLLIGTVIDFPEGSSSLESKIKEAEEAIKNGVDELDFVCNYEAFKDGYTALVKQEVLIGTQIGLAKNKTIKWIIETAALSDKEIIQISALIKNVVLSNFREDEYTSVFVKSSTGFYKTENDLPNGATIPVILMMLENASPLPVKAAGGVRSYEDAVEMINLGVKRIGTSAAKKIADGENTTNQY